MESGMTTRIDLSELDPEEAWRELRAILRTTPWPVDELRPVVVWIREP
jgi:hypothetical protein